MGNSRYFFRFDAGGAYGLGHYARCLAIIRTLLEVEPNAQVYILSEDTPFMSKKKHELPFNILLEGTVDSNLLVKYIAQIKPGVCFFDKLEELDEGTIRAIREYTRIILFHNYSRSAAVADAVIIPAAHVSEDRLPFLKTPNAEDSFYIGPSYVTINENVLCLRNQFQVRDTATSVAVTTGGTDPKGVMLALLDMIDFARFTNISFDFLVGEGFLYRDRLEPFRSTPNVNLVPFELGALLRSDIAIATFGVTTYELLYLGIPVISVAHALSNAEGSRFLATRYQCIEDIGYIDQLEKGRLNSVIDSLVNDASKRRRFHEKGLHLIDGQGVQRVRDIILDVKTNQ